MTYEAASDPTGSFNSTSADKTNFWQYVNGLFGASLAVDRGLAGNDMPGAANVPKQMTFEPASAWFIAAGIPITPYDDAGHKNPYPLMKLVARNAAGTLLATTQIVLPVSDEMSCASCHASGTSDAAKPRDGWVQDPDAQRDFRLNILALHDDNHGATALFQQAVGQVGYNPAGLMATVTQDHRSILCASCHSSEALGTGGVAGVQPLTQAIHRSMAGSIDPKTGLALDATNNRTACYTCHPGSATRCLRGAMGASVATDGTMAMQCQSCHGKMTDVGASQRTGWLNEPRCDGCHTGTAMHNNGAIRYTSVFQADGSVRQAVDATFATNNNTPAAGLSLYRFSTGHGGLQCSACHGSTHAEFPSSHDNDNIQSQTLQGHKGVLADCSTCHATTPQTVAGGPHGMHPIGAQWISSHGDAAEDGRAGACRACHGSDYRGTVLSRSQGDRVFSTEFGTKKFWRGSQIGCYACHQGPSSENSNPNRAAVVTDATAATSVDKSVNIPLKATDADGNALTLRVVSQPTFGTVGLQGKQAVYYPDGASTGTDVFTFAAWDGSIDSNLGTVRVTVGDAQCAPECQTAAGCDPNCTPATTHDAFVSQPKPVRIAIPAAGTTVHRVVSVSVSNLDATGSAAQTIRLETLDGDCPNGTVQGTPTFVSVGSDGPGSVDLAAGLSATAQVSLSFAATDFSSPTPRAPERCTLILRASPVGSTDPTPANNDALLEVSVRDRSDTKDAGATEAFLDSVAAVTLTITTGNTAATALATPRVALDAPTTAPRVALRVTTDDGTCPAGTIGAVDLNASTDGVQDTVNLRGGKSRRGSVPVRAAATAFSTPTAPTRCTALITVTYTGPGGDVSNDITRLVLTVKDANDK
ncbi:MAG: hypothetical protein HY899_17945 [Deltaproteobacteria bacterium]|nr:hypothetical protein [Deltaproteobacteria bacterium]